MSKLRLLLVLLSMISAGAAFWTLANAGEKVPTSKVSAEDGAVPYEIQRMVDGVVSKPEACSTAGVVKEVEKENEEEEGKYRDEDNDTEEKDDDEDDEDGDKGEDVPLSEVPARVLETVNKAVPGGEIKEVKKEVEDGVVIYGIQKVVDDVEYEVEVTADGVVKEIEKEGNVRIWNFDADASGKTAPGFRVAETRGEGKFGTWQVVRDPTASSSPNVFAVAKTENYGSTFNLAIAEDTSCKNLDISVKVKAVSGKEDQGGGPIWRAKDADNYYIARWNPLENNFRVY